MELFAGVGSAVESSDTTTDAAIDIPAGLTRMWFRNGAGYTLMARGSIACVNVEQTALSDAIIADWFDLFDATDEDRKALLDETHGILYKIEPGDFEILNQKDDDKFLCSLSLREVDRVGAPSVQDA